MPGWLGRGLQMKNLDRIRTQPPAARQRRVAARPATFFTLGPLDVTVPRGAIYGLVGPNGAGGNSKPQPRD
jgi:ABC-type multidrug transport system ATPase subunit